MCGNKLSSLDFRAKFFETKLQGNFTTGLIVSAAFFSQMMHKILYMYYSNDLLSMSVLHFCAYLNTNFKHKGPKSGLKLKSFRQSVPLAVPWVLDGTSSPITRASATK